MKDRKKAEFEKIQKITFIENFLYLFSFVFFVCGIGIISYYYSKSSTNKLFFQNPLDFISELSLPGFAISGFTMGIGLIMCNGGILHHFLYGLPTLSGQSFLVVILFFIFSGITVLTRSKTMSWLLDTQQLYTESLIGFPYASVGLISAIFFILIILFLVILQKSNMLKTLDGVNRGRFLNL
jgi:hypothetical protein